MSKNSLFCPKKESSITQKVLIEIFFNVIFHLMYMIWLDLDAKSALDTGTPSVEAHKCAVVGLEHFLKGSDFKMHVKMVNILIKLQVNVRKPFIIETLIEDL